MKYKPTQTPGLREWYRARVCLDMSTAAALIYAIETARLPAPAQRALRDAVIQIEGHAGGFDRVVFLH